MGKWIRRAAAVAIVYALVKNLSVEAICHWVDPWLQYLPSLQSATGVVTNLVAKFGNLVRDVSSFLYSCLIGWGIG